MAERTGIAWADHTFNPWIGCTQISCACARCYAKALVERWGGKFGQRRRTAPANWRLPLRWNKAAELAGVRRRVFCASLADVFDNQADPAWRADLFELVRACPALDWLLLTKRPSNIAGMLPADWGEGWRNVWLGATAEDQAHFYQRWPHLAAVPARLRFLSYEPALGPIGDLRLGRAGAPRWVIVGGESGAGARPMALEWVRDVRLQCNAADVAFFFKQTGSNRVAWPGVTGKGDKPEQWPRDLRRQETPGLFDMPAPKRPAP